MELVERLTRLAVAPAKRVGPNAQRCRRTKLLLFP
jgi:hypothetical protein